MKVLELFSGTGSIGKCCKKIDWDVVSVDMILPADHNLTINNIEKTHSILFGLRLLVLITQNYKMLGWVE